MASVDIGAELRQARIAQGLALEDVAQRTKISPRFLQAIEADAFDNLPGLVFTRNFVRLYADAVKVDPELMLAELPKLDDSMVKLPEPPKTPRSERWDSREKSLLNAAAWILAIGGAGFALYSNFIPFHLLSRENVQRTIAQNDAPAPAKISPPTIPAEPAPGASASASASAGAAAPAPVVTPGTDVAGAASAIKKDAVPDKPVPETVPDKTVADKPGVKNTVEPVRPVADSTVPNNPPVAAKPVPGNKIIDAKPEAKNSVVDFETGAAKPVAHSPVHVLITAREPSWVSLTADGKSVFTGTLQANESRDVSAEAQVNLVAGNAGGLAVTLNGKALGPIGSTGQVRTVRLTAEGPQFLSKAPQIAPFPSDPF